MTYLVMAAVPAETRYLPPDVRIVHLGIGKTAAAIAATRALAELKAPERASVEVINVGSCGALVDGMKGVYEPGVVLNHDISARALRALGHDPQERLVLERGDANVTLATGDVFVADTGVRQRLAQHAHLVDMEGYAVALACRAFDVPVRLVKHVSDDADEYAVEWKDLVERSARDLGQWWRTTMSA